MKHLSRKGELAPGLPGLVWIFFSVWEALKKLYTRVRVERLGDNYSCENTGLLGRGADSVCGDGGGGLFMSGF